MYRAICLFVSMLLLISICGCGNHVEHTSNDQNLPSTTTAVPTVPSTTQFPKAAMAFSTRAVVSNVGVDYDYPAALIINAKESIEMHLSRLPYPEWAYLLEQVDQYEDAFFETHSLILIWNAPSSTSEVHSVKAVTQVAADEIEILVEKAVPEGALADVVCYLNIVELECKIPEKTVCNVKYTIDMQ